MKSKKINKDLIKLVNVFGIVEVERAVMADLMFHTTI